MQKYMNILSIAAPCMEEVILEVATKKCLGTPISRNFTTRLSMTASNIMFASG